MPVDQIKVIIGGVLYVPLIWQFLISCVDYPLIIV